MGGLAPQPLKTAFKITRFPRAIFSNGGFSAEKLAETLIREFVVCARGEKKMAAAVEPVKIVRKPKAPGAFRESRYRHMMSDIEGRMRKYQQEVGWWLQTDEEYFKMRIPYDSLADLDAKVSKILDEEGIIGTDRIKYLNFARRLWKLAYTYTFLKSSTVNSMRALYRSMGAKERILKRIEQLFVVPLIEEREAEGGAGGAQAAAPITE